MKVKAMMKYLGTEERKTKDGKTYTVCGLLQGFDTEQVFINDELKRLCGPITPMSDVECQLNIRITGERTFVNLEDIRIVPEKVKK